MYRGGVLAERSSRDLYIRLLGYVRPHWRVFAVSLLTMVLTGATEPLFPALMKPLLDGSFLSQQTTNLYLIPAAVIGIFMLRGVLTFVSSYTLGWVTNRMLSDIRSSMFAQMMIQPMWYFDRQAAGVLMCKVTNDVGAMISAATTVLTVLVRESIKVMALLGWLFYLNWKLTLISLIVAPAMGFAVRIFSRRLRQMSHESMRAMGQLTQVLEESIACQKVVKVFGGQAHEAQRFNRVSESLRGFNMRQAIAAGATVPISQ